MEYSINEVAKLANISVRAIRYYDEIRLLQPQIRMTSGKRYYGEEQLLKLMDILFLKNLGFSLKEISYILALGNRDKRAVLKEKKIFLQKELKRIEEQIESIDLTLEIYFKGENINPDKSFQRYELFQKASKQSKNDFVKEFGSLEDEEEVKEKKMPLKEQQKYYQEMTKNLDTKKYVKKTSACYQQLITAIENRLKADSNEVQNIMKEYYNTLNVLRPISKKKWLRIGISISEQKLTYNLYANMHPHLPEFFAQAIKIYGQNLKE